MMSLLEELRVIENKPYVPIYSGRLYSTSAHSRNKLISISHQKNLQKNRAKSSSFNVRAQSIKTNYESDGLSECSTHISLLSLESIEMPKRINYGSIGHYSPFERFTNRRIQKSLKDNFYLIQTVLTHYQKIMKKYMLQNEEDFMEPNLIDLLEYELMMLYNVSNTIVALPSRHRSNSISSQIDILSHEAKFLCKASKEVSEIYKQKIYMKYRTKSKSIEFLDDLAKNPNMILTYRKKKVNREILNSRIKFENDNSSAFLNSSSMREPKLSVLELKDNKRHKYSSIQSIRPYSTATGLELTHENKYNGVESKLKHYIRSDRRIKSSNSYTQRNYSRVAINNHLLAEEKKKLSNEDASLKICSHLTKTIREDIKSNKGPVYIASVTKAALERFDKTISSSKSVTTADKFLIVFNWLKDIDKEDYVENTTNYELSTENRNVSLLSNIVSENFIESVSNLNSSSFHVYSSSGLHKKSPNIFLPKFIVDNKQTTRQLESPQKGFNDRMVTNLLHHYHKRIEDELLDYQMYPHHMNDKEKNEMEVSNNVSQISDYHPTEKIIAHEKLNRARMRNDLLLTRIKLDLFAM